MAKMALDILLKEFIITQRLLQSNGLSILIYFVVCLVPRMIANPITALRLLFLTPGFLFLNFWYTYCFEILNQATSVAEDKINKPYRPIPSGLLSLDGAYKRLYIIWSLCPLLILTFSGKWAAIHFVSLQGLNYFCYVHPKPNNWLCRNAFTAISAASIARLLNAYLSQRVPEWDTSTSTDFLVPYWVMASIHLQEFHDVDGDKATGRKSLPIILNPRSQVKLRIATAFFLVVYSFGVCYFALIANNSRFKLLTHVISVLQAISVLVLSFRVIESKGKRFDEMTYRAYYHITYALTDMCCRFLMM